MSSKLSISIGLFLHHHYSLLDIYGPLECFQCLKNIDPKASSFRLFTLENLLQALSPSDPLSVKGINIIHTSGAPPLQIESKSNQIIDINNVNKKLFDVFIIPSFNSASFDQIINTNKEALHLLAQIIVNSQNVLCCGNGIYVLYHAILTLTDKQLIESLLEKLAEPSIYNNDHLLLYNPSLSLSTEWISNSRYVIHHPIQSISASHRVKAIITTAYSAAMTDMACYLITDYFGPMITKKVCEITEYVPVSDENCTNDKKISHEAPVMVPEKGLKIGVILYDNFEMYDLFGPMHLLVSANRYFGKQVFEIYFFSESQSVKSSLGPYFHIKQAIQSQIVPEYKLYAVQDDVHSINDPIIKDSDMDVLFIPGGIGCIREVNNYSFKKWLRALCEYTLSKPNNNPLFIHKSLNSSASPALSSISMFPKILTVCTGSMILASLSSSSLLAYRQATTNKLSYLLATSYGSSVRWKPEARYVVDEQSNGVLATSSGVSAGVDMTINILNSLFINLGPFLVKDIGLRASVIDDSQMSLADPFSHTIPKGFMAWLGSRMIKWLTFVIVPIGLSLGFNMFTSKLIQ